MSNKMSHKVYIITGASEGIGFALAEALALTDSPKLVLAARNSDRLAILQQQLIEQGLDADNILAVPTDITIETDCQQLIAQTVSRFGQIDYLINNAGITMWSEFDQLTDLSVFDKVYQVNVMGAVYCSYYALPHLKKTQGTIVAVASLAGLVGVPTRSAYAASKHAMIGFFDSLRIEQKANNVNIVTVAPDFVVSQIHKRALDKDGQPLQQSPMQEQKIMSSEDCALFIINAIKKNKRLAIPSLRGKLGQILKVFCPALIDHLAARAIRLRR
ncbi:MAG: short-subunit dehydrogenase [Phenylobacterium sp.]|jgi:short-subunit dehydrogenase